MKWYLQIIWKEKYKLVLCIIGKYSIIQYGYVHMILIDYWRLKLVSWLTINKLISVDVAVYVNSLLTLAQ